MSQHFTRPQFSCFLMNLPLQGLDIVETQARNFGLHDVALRSVVCGWLPEIERSCLGGLNHAGMESNVRAPKRKRPAMRKRVQAPQGFSLTQAAQKARYVGSAEHKDTPSYAGNPRPRADASICDKALSDKPRQLSKWLRKAIRTGNVGAPFEGKYPRYAWHKDGEDVYEARLVNRGSGEYKGYKLRPEEHPEDLL